MSSGKILYFASGNPNKVLEVQQLLNPNYQVLSLKDLSVNDIPETGLTLEENSLIKARYVFDTFKVDVFADDTGLEVEALNGEPGVYSARYAGLPPDSNRNMAKLIKGLAGIENRSARFRTVITLIQKGEIHQFEGIVKGAITMKNSGHNGFGYDPIFKPIGSDKTFAEMDADEKNAISHRGLAIRKFVDFLLY